LSYSLVGFTNAQLVARALKESNWGSPASIVMKAFPEHKWEPWKFARSKHRNTWPNNPNLVTQYFDWLKQQLGLSSMEAWYNVTYRLVAAHQGLSPFR